jgi:hypothetical protein
MKETERKESRKIKSKKGKEENSESVIFSYVQQTVNDF